MANMANISEEEQVNTFASDSLDKDQENVLKTHLMMSKTAPRRGQAALKREAYNDGESGVTYEVVKGGTRRGADRLIDSLGFQYTLKHGRGNDNLKYWWCAVRNTKLRCPASVVQHGNVFMRGKHKHEHFVGQSSPKPDDHQTTKKTPKIKSARSASPSIITTSDLVVNKIKGNDEYKIIKEGSKAGMDLLKDCFGYTYTQKKLCKKGLRRYWTCSVRNRYLRCPAIVSQVGNIFTDGSQDHQHMPGCKTPAGENDVIPKRSSLEGIRDYSYGKVDSGDGDSTDDDDDGYTYDKSIAKSSDKQNSKKILALASRERKKKEHPTFLGPSCTINLTKCVDPACNCKMVHCPFCDPAHFLPAKAGRIQDHLELTHFAYGVQYDDLMIVKCFYDCSGMERNFGHFHCVFCYQHILKRYAYARHMLRHMRKLGIPDKLLVLPDPKYPDVINAYGYEILICKKSTCQQSCPKHYHCPQCKQVCMERSLTVNHLWRCLQRSSSDTTGSEDDEVVQTVDESQLNLHFSHFKSFKDLPFEKCILQGCCNQKYHCRMCPTDIFFPSYRQHLSAHYVSHWKQQVQYKGYHLLKCFHYCEGIDRSLCKTKFHFHCPICRKIILSKTSFESHIKLCHMLKFGEHLGIEELVEFENGGDEDITIVHQECGPIIDYVEYMENKLTSRAIAHENERRLEKYQSCIKKKSMNKPAKQFGTWRNQLVQTIKDEISEALEAPCSGGQESDCGAKNNNGEHETTDLSDDMYGMNILEDEIYDLGSVLFSEKFIQALKSACVVNSVLNKVTAITNTRFTQEGTRYLLSGRLEDLVTVKKLLTQAITGEDRAESNIVSEGSLAGRNTNMYSLPKKMKCFDDDDETQSPTNGKGGKISSSDKKDETVKKERSRMNDDSFPYSEIKQIIATSKKTNPKSHARERRTSKKLPVAVLNQKKSSGIQKETPSTPSRYSTRGIKRNYVEMSSGRVQIKKEPQSDNGKNDDSDAHSLVSNNDAEEEECTPKRDNRKGQTKLCSGRSRNTRQLLTDEEDENDINGFLDNSAQEEIDQINSENEHPFLHEDDEGEEVEMKSAATNKIIVSPSKLNKDQNITDSTVKGLKTSNVSASVPIISKIGIRKAAVGKRWSDSNEQNESALAKKLLIFAKADVDGMRCSLCDEFYASSFSALTSHLMDLHHVYKPPRCDICETDFDNVLMLSRHIETKHGPKKQPINFQCSYVDCDKVFLSQNGLSAHVSSVHLGISTAEKDKKYCCNKCDFMTNSMKDIYEHKKIDHGETINCDDCQKTFSSYQSLKVHRELKHSLKGPIACKECGKVLSSEKLLKRHMDLHLIDLVCHICFKQVTSKASMKAHLEIHKPEEVRSYRFVCSYCGKKFTLKSNFEDHLNKHTGNKPYKCDICMKTFGFRSMLKKHNVFVHSSERPFKCGYCMKGFKFMNLLRNHVTKHTNTSKHICANCSKCFSTASTLKFHMHKCNIVSGNQPIFLGDPSGPSEEVICNDANAVSTNGTSETQQPLIVSVEKNISLHEQLMAQEQMVEDLPQLLRSGEESADIVLALTTSGNTAAPAELEVYACSECSATFAVFKDAEAHVLNCMHTRSEMGI